MQNGLFLFFLLPLPLTAQSVSTLMGARAAGMGYASACLQDEWALFNNVAGLTGQTEFAASISYHLQPQLPGGNRMASLIILPLPVGIASAGVFRFGDDLYHEQLACAGFAHALGIASLGIKMTYIQYFAEGIGTQTAWGINLGGIAQLTPVLKFGAYIIHINQPKLSNSGNEHLDPLFLAGFSYSPAQKATLSAELEKRLHYPSAWKSGFEYQFNKKFSFRTGFQLNPDQAFLGLGFQTKKIHWIYASQFHPVWGISHQLTVTLLPMPPAPIR